MHTFWDEQTIHGVFSLDFHTCHTHTHKPVRIDRITKRPTFQCLLFFLRPVMGKLWPGGGLLSFFIGPTKLEYMIIIITKS